MALAPYSLPVEVGPDGKLRARRDQHEAAINGVLSPIDARITVAESGIDGVNAALSTLSDQVSQIETGSAEGIIVEATKANLDARATSLGLGAGDAGRAGRVYEDGTAANNGDWRWTGSAWSYLGADRIGRNETSIANLSNLTLQLTGGREIIVDQMDRLGGGPAVYIPRQMALFANGATVINLTLASDTKLTAYHKVVISGTTTVYQVVYYDKVDGVVKVSMRPAIAPADPARYFHLITISGQGQGWASAMKVVSTVDWRSTFVSAYPIAFDAGEGKLYLPQLWGLKDSGGVVWNLQPLTTDENWREVTVPMTGSVTFIYVDIYAAVANSRDPDALVISQGNSNRPVRDGTAIVLLGAVFSGVFTPANPDIVVANLVPNQFGAGREDNNLADMVFPGTVAADLTRAESLALGFTHGWTPSGTSAFYGGRFPQPTNSGFYFYRYFIETDVADDFGTPVVYMIARNPGGSNHYTFGPARLYKQHSSYLAEYCGYMRVDGDRPVYGFWNGLSSGNAGQQRVFGMQGWLGATDNPWISRRDYPRIRDELGARVRALEAVSNPVSELEPLIPPVLYVHPDRPYRIYADQMLRQRGAYRLVLEDQRTSYGPVGNMEVAGGSIVSSAITEGVVTWHFESVATPGQKKTATTSVVAINPADISGIDIGVLCLGDSITDWDGGAVHPVRRLRDMGATVASIGTMGQFNTIAGTGDSELGEGRSNRRMADFYGLTEDRMQLIPVGDESVYLGLTNAEKREWNPFLKVADAADLSERPEMIFAGNIFDMRFYLDRFDLDDPKIVIINLATNDYGAEEPEVAAEHVATGLGIIVSQTRRALPDAKIVLVYNTRGSGTASQTLWENGFWACLEEYFKFTLEDGDVTLVPGYCTIDRVSGFNYALTADPDTGVSSGTVSDTTHYGPAGRAEYGEVVAQFIAGALTE